MRLNAPAAFPPLPIEPALPDLRAALRHSTALVLQAPPGAGKTTRVPLALLNELWLAGRSILLLEPRRLAARAAAARMADLLGEPVGATVGYHIRFDRQISHQTRIEVLTEGLLTRRLQRDPALDGVGLVIFDEFHERSLHADLALALCLDSQRGLRTDLRLLVMSATLNGAAVAQLLGDASIIATDGRTHPVIQHYLPHDPEGLDLNVVVRTVLTALAEHIGDLLVFLPGSGEIRQVQRRLETQPACDGLALIPLYGDLPGEVQQRAIQPDPEGRRKIVLTTPIAETSLTIEGVSVVVDAGWTRVPRFDPGSGLTRLETIRISADAAEQRAGRAGRLGPGICYRLWSTATHRRLRPQRIPEILEADLVPLALELAQWGVADPTTLAWLDPPPSGALAQARTLLTDLEALDDQDRITPTGQDLAELPTHPRLAHLLRCGAALGQGALSADLAALLEERDLLRGEHAFGSDITTRLEALQAFRRDGREGARRWQADPAACARVDQVARRWRQRLKAAAAPEIMPDSTLVGRLLALAYPDRVARRRENSADRYQLANGRGARLTTGDPLMNRDWLAVAHLDAGASEGRIWLAAPVDPADLAMHLASRVRTVTAVFWDERQAAVIARREQRLGALALSSAPLTDVKPDVWCQAMLTGVRQLGLHSLSWTPELQDWRARVLSLRCWFPNEDWPDLSDAWLAEHLAEWLGPWLEGITRREHLSRLDLAAVLHGLLNHRQQAQLNELTPTHLSVPSGSRIRLRYLPGESPVLAVKLQELFGLADTPRIAGGRIPVILHLLSPAQRPIQVTQDLRGFWERTYAGVKKELKGRYPKHPWPDDPWTAVPTRRARSLKEFVR
ncbi:MAG TPA: ATP-dependent helicase HrpB [Candidatus Competibacteraceae bacterium]|nr:ATP-dependent helicase HrpB [Candidatus Competibacteraceae bacterium]HSA45733.1 ATP-dependent helicase HrpB [Candidatus Competibacteraceae bacterium]